MLKFFLGLPDSLFDLFQDHVRLFALKSAVVFGEAQQVFPVRPFFRAVKGQGQGVVGEVGRGGHDVEGGGQSSGVYSSAPACRPSART